MAGDVHQEALTTAVARVLTRIAGRPVGVPSEPSHGSALDLVCSCFGLTPFERDVLVLAAAVEIDPAAAESCLQTVGGRAYPTFSLALTTLAEPHWSALAPVSPLRRWHLIELEPDVAVTTARLRIDERILHLLAGMPYLDARLHGLVTPLDPAPPLPGTQQVVAAALSAVWARGSARATLVGADHQTRREVVAAAATDAGVRAYAARAADLPTDAVEREALARLWDREAILLPGALVVEVDDAGPERREVAAAFCRSTAAPVVLSAAEVTSNDRVGERIPVAAPLPHEQRELWAAALDGAVPLAEADLNRLVAQFTLPGHVIRAAASDARRRASSAGPSAPSSAPGASAGADAPGDPVAGRRGSGYRLAWQAGLDHARMALDDLGRRITPRASWDDLVLPAAQRAVLGEIVAHVRRRSTVHDDWGFEDVLRRGLGVTALFAGGSGTGKTLAAEVLASELGLDLFVIDLSQVVNKYIGETEKNLRRVFDAAERGGAVLLFDEADALFGKRSEVKDSHDRYANIEVSYLLMRMEAYRGLAILTSNMKKSMDSAFLRRLRFVVDFPFPDAPERAEIWRRVIPGRAPAEGLDTARLAQLTVSGGSIRNIALSAAFLAADEGVPLQMRHVLAATRTEYLKLERSVTSAEVAGWQ
ncbi:ATP-binding protein [Mangrovihabitans endophyticus]|uniref:ATPase n=1 Tax=Mangrovihabitans endophyticus TaxID=1751298 RepID=A0A8J3BSZ6_9ACTN|nr:ATP-binding protein [Mangrovihabitans endophyticus]GGK74503.1 ATPase [Mangrovihabitans endophyticus]